MVVGSACPFPRVWPAAADGIVNASTAVAADCTQTYAQRLGAGYVAIQVISLVIPIFSFTIIGLQVLHLFRLAKQQPSARAWDHPTFGFFICALAYNTYLILEGVDLFNFTGLYPPQLYVILDELVGASCMSLGVILVDFWVRCAKFNSRVGFPRGKLAVFILTIIANFVGFGIVAVCDPAHYRVYEAVKSLIGAVLLLGFFVQGKRSVRALQSALSSSSLANKDSADNNNQNAKAVRVLGQKYIHFSVVLVIATLMLFINGVVVLITAAETREWHWKIDFFLQPDPLQYSLRGLFLTASLACLSFFKVGGLKPKNGCCGGGDGSINRRVGDVEDDSKLQQRLSKLKSTATSPPARNQSKELVAGVRESNDV